MTEDGEYRGYSGSKVPVFDGRTENWSFYKVKMTSYLARLDLGHMTGDKGKNVPKDTTTVPTDATAKEVFEEKCYPLLAFAFFYAKSETGELST